MRSPRKRQQTSRKQFSLKEVIAFASLSISIGYGLAYFYIENFELPLIIEEQSKELTVCFTPNPVCQQMLLASLNKARKSIQLQGYAFSDKAIAEALIKAKKRGVAVEIILDKSNKTDKHSQAPFLAQNNIPIFIDSPPGIAHNKTIIIDETTIYTGSYNWSEGAHKRNTENLLMIKNVELSQRYIQNWENRKAASVPFSRNRQ